MTGDTISLLITVGIMVDAAIGTVVTVAYLIRRDEKRFLKEMEEERAKLTAEEYTPPCQQKNK